MTFNEHWDDHDMYWDDSRLCWVKPFTLKRKVNSPKQKDSTDALVKKFTKLNARCEDDESNFAVPRKCMELLRIG
jgi:hypothetical protein